MMWCTYSPILNDSFTDYSYPRGTDELSRTITLNGIHANIIKNNTAIKINLTITR